MTDEPSRRPAHAPPRPINAYAIFLKTSYAWTRKRLGAAAPELAVLDEIAKEWDALDEPAATPTRRSRRRTPRATRAPPPRTAARGR